MKLSYAFLLVVLVVGLIPAHADTVIAFGALSNGITFTPTAGGQYVSFGGLKVGDNSTDYPAFTGDSSFGTNVNISPGTGAHFFFNSVSADGMTGYFASNVSSNLTIGSNSSGYLRGSLSNIEISTTPKAGSTKIGNGTFSLTLVLNNLTYTSCSSVGCTDSTLLKTFANIGNGGNASNTLTFSFSGLSGNKNASTLMGLAAAKSSGVEGTFDSIYDTVTPEPASLALFGSCLLMAGMKLHRRAVKS